MMREYQVIWNEKSLKELSRLGRKEARRIQAKVERHLVKAPQELGKPLTGPWKNLYRYRIGDYRVIYEIRKQEIVLVVVKVGNRRDVYEG
jgi:mRNA interferase RelE/StbE